MSKSHQLSQNFDSLAFRTALGSFATGVTIVTTRDGQGNPVGMTASSFNSVSLEPPLVLWSIARTANCFDAFDQADHFAIHILNQQQQPLSDLFGRPSPKNKFAGLDIINGCAHSPLLPDFNSLFECKLEHRYDGGDHIILVGRVLQFELRGGEPLLFAGGQYRQMAPLPAKK